MNQSLPTRAFREHTDLNQLKRQAKELLDSFRTGDGAANAEVMPTMAPLIPIRSRFTTPNWFWRAPTALRVGRS
jgi:hypothetical protein